MGLVLSEDVYFCTANRQLAFLDVRADKYFALPGNAESAFRKLVSNDCLTEDDFRALEPLRSRRILMPFEGPNNVRAEVKSPRPATSIVDEGPVKISPLEYWRVADAIAAQLASRQFLRRHGLRNVIRKIAEDKVTGRRRALGMKEPIDNSRTLAAFLFTRRLVTTQDQCLVWSIALVNLLARHGTHVDLVIGVRMKPFRAHAWAQLDTAVLSDRLDTVAPYTPILVA